MKRKKITSVLLSICLIIAALPISAIIPASAVGTTTTVSTLTALQTALADASVSEIIVSRAIALTDGTILEGNNKTVRVTTTGLNEQGIVQTGSTYNVFTIASGATVKLYDMTVMGGSTNAVTNAGTLYLENVTITLSGSASVSGGGGVYNTGTLVMTDSSIVRNVAQYGGGFYNGKNATIIMDGCSLSENRSLDAWGGGGAGENDGVCYMNNCTVSNNTSSEIGGGINNTKGGQLYLMNSTFTGNVSNVSNTNYGGAIGNNALDGTSTVKAVNCIFAYNYVISGTTVTKSDIGMYNSSSNAIYLYHSIYGAIIGGTASATSDCSTTTTGLFADTLYGGVLYGDGTSSTTEFEKPAVVKNESGELYSPISGDYTGTAEGVPTYFDYSDLSNIRMYFTEVDQNGLVTDTEFFAGSAIKNTDLSVGSAMDGDDRAQTLIGSANTLSEGSEIFTITVQKSDNGTVSGGTIFGDSYIVTAEKDKTVTLTATGSSGYYFSTWTIVSGTQPANTSLDYNPLAFKVTGNLTLKAVFTATAPTYTVSYDADGAGSGTMADQTFTPSTRTQNLSANTFTSTHGTFQGWSLVEGKDVVYSDGEEYTAVGNVKLYARWGYQINFDANGGRKAPANDVKDYDVNYTISSTLPSRDGYYFLGWAQSASATTATYQPGGAYSANEGTTFYAVWEQLKAPSLTTETQTPDYGVTNEAYTYTLATDQDAIFTSSDLPSWLTMSKTGVLTGTPGQAGSYTFNVTLTNKKDTSYTSMVAVTVNVYDYCDVSALQTTVNNNTVQSTDESLYTAETWAAYENALATAENLITYPPVNITDSGNQDTVNNANTALINAIAALTYKPANYSELNTAIYLTEQMDTSSMYPDANKTAFEQALADAKACATNLDITQQSVIDNLTKALQDAAAALNYYCDYQQLATTIGSANDTVASTDEAKYVPSAWQRYENALTAAESINNADKLIDDSENVNQASIDAAEQELANALANLLNNKYCEYDQIASAITDANNAISSADESQYTPEAWQRYENALTAAESINNADKLIDDSENVNQTTIDNATSELRNALSNLDSNKYCNYENIAGAITNANNSVSSADESQYTPEAWQRYENALAAAEAINNADKLVDDSENVNQTSIDDATNELTNALNNLAANKYCNYENIADAISNANNSVTSADESKYTHEAWQRYENALTAAEAINNADKLVDDSENVNQTAINTASDELVNALNNLMANEYCDYTNLDAAKNDASAIITENDGRYPTAEWNAYKSALDEANAIAGNLVKDSGGTNQKAINDAASALNNAIANLNASENFKLTVKDGSGATTDTVYVSNNGTTTFGDIKSQITDPTTDDNHTFAGWTDGNGNAVTDETVITGDMILNPVIELSKITPNSTGNTLNVDRDTNTEYVYMVGMNTAANSASELKASLENDDVQIIITRNDVVLTNDDLVGTGCIVKCVSAKDPTIVYEVATVILYGDVNGDGVVDATDSEMLESDAFFGTTQIALNTVFRIAADMNGDGTLDAFDWFYQNGVMTGGRYFDQSVTLYK